MTVSVYGAGTLGVRLVPRLTGAVRAITRTPARHQELADLGADPTLDWSATGDRVILCLPGSALQLKAIEYLRSSHPERAVLVSTVGYHAPYEGEISGAAARGSSPRARLVEETEAAFEDWMGERGVIVRLGGLYLPDRGPAAHYARTGKIRSRPGDAPLALIHYDDAASLVVAALNSGEQGPLLGITEVVQRRVFYTTLAHHLGAEEPPFEDDRGTPVSFDLADSQRLLKEVAYPDWRACLPERGS